MTIEKIVSILGKPGLYKVLSQSKNGVIVESLENGKRFPVSAVHQISALSDIAIYTYDEEVPLKDVFYAIFEKENGKETINPKSDKDTLKNFMREILPEYDEERVYVSNIKKLAQWYNTLVKSGFDFKNLKDSDKDNAGNTAENDKS